MPRTIDVKTRVSAVKDYVTSGDSLRVVSERHGISMETLRRFVGEKMRKPGKKNAAPKNVMSIPFPASKKRAGKDVTRPNANRRWSKAEDELLRDAVLGNFTVKETMDLLGRTNAAITTRKHILLENGFINEKRFKIPEGITRNRRTREEIVHTQEISTPVASEEKIVSPAANNTFVSETPSLRELAGLVQEFGVRINMTVSAEGTVINIHN